MSVYNRQLYILLLKIKAWNKVYNRMSTEVLDSNVIVAVQLSFYDKVFSSQRLNL